ncbi:ABC transporter permease [Goodfellowiella coeruleoviolacea]|uniref:Autoinducer 2 import system permease protein LsrC n=1 Tax=Goodfellowiella coeruleoviolacea TaxID=334858 RepID=A0AAE3KET6_9PSEU|nr:ABC transporter permease [Goodfellowiella coeruleoviolacea]MCP2164212.1 rhamnose transport system permease protein [Goodfellowiella coeruleoviolacea]
MSGLTVESDVDQASAGQRPARRGAAARRLVDRVGRVRELGILVALVVVVAVTAVANPAFVSPQSLRDLLLNASIIALLAVGQTLVVVTRNVDLSVGSVLGLAAFLTAQTFAANPGLPLLPGLLLGVLIGLACGALNGLVVAAGQVPSLVVTLGTLYVFRGLDFTLARGRQVNAADLPDALLSLGSGRLLGIPNLVLITLVVIAAGALYLRAYRSGRELYAIGSNPDAAVLAGIPVGRRVFVAFTVSGAVAGLAGALWMARYGTVDAAAGTGLELQVVSAVVVGGVVISGGSGTVAGAALGALLLGTITSCLVVLRIPAFWQQAITGALLLAAITVDRLVALRLAAALRRSSRAGRRDEGG